MKLALFKKTTSPINFSFFSRIFDNPELIVKILKKHPPLPVFITDSHIIKKRLEQIPKFIKVAYSFKTNYDVAQNFNFQMAEVVSEFELKMAIKQKYPYSSIIFNGPNKGNLHHLLSHPLTINLDNFTELKNLIEYKKNIKADIGLRINSNFHPSRFGFNIESGDAQKAILLLQKNHIPLSGLHLHLGSDIQNPTIYQKYSIIVKNFISQNLSQNTLKYIDFGGGYPSHSIISGTSIQAKPDIKRYIEAISKPLKQYINKDTSLIIEPGRYLVDDSTFLVSQVIDSKIISNSQSIILNTTINMLPSAWYHHLIIKTFNSHFIPKKVDTKIINTCIYGCTCQESDILYQGKLPYLTRDDYIVFIAVGAYNLSQSSDFIFEKPKSIFI
ncbi:MAG: hypothetical protein WC503_03755 [Candidatus Shapirobacteria bacterium]